MAILSRPKISPQQRFDLEDWEALLASLRADSKLYTKQFKSSENLIQKGFAVSGVGLKSALVQMANASLIMSEGTSDFSYFTSASAEPDIAVPDADLTDNARNYLEIQLCTADGVPLTKAFWDPDATGGAGQEFNQVVNTITDIQVKIITSTGGFSGSVDTLPLAIIDVNGSGDITSIFDRRELFGRLARPNDLDKEYTWGTKLEPTYSLALSGASGALLAGEQIAIGGETAIVVTGGTTSITINAPTGLNFFPGNTITGATSGETATITTILESFTGADKSISNDKELFDALMTEIKLMKKTRFWWQDANSSLNGVSDQLNTLITQISIDAFYNWSGTALSITDNSGTPANANPIAGIEILGQSQILRLTRQDGSGGSTTLALADGDVLFIKIPSSGDVSYSDTGVGASNYQTVAKNDYIVSDENYWLGYRQGTKIYMRGYGELEPGETAPISDPAKAELELLINTHITDTANPHAVTQTQVGLGNVDNTSDATKDDATATLTNKTLTSPVINSPTGIVKADVGLGNVNNTSDATKNAAIVVLTNKDYDGGTASNTNRMTMPQDTTANLALLTNKKGTYAYDTTLDSLVINDGTGWNKVTGAGSGSGINYVTNQDFEDNSDDVTVTANITKALEVTNKLRNTQSLKITIDTLATTADYVDFDLNTFDDQDTDESKEVVIVFDINSSNANYTSDDVEFVLRDVTNSIDIPISNDDNGLIKNVNGNRTFVGVAQTVSGVTDYKLRMNILVAPTTDSILYFDTMKVGPDTFGPGNIAHGAKSFTPSFTNFTLGDGTIDISEFTRAYGVMNGRVEVTLGSTSVMGIDPFITVPNGELIDTVIHGTSYESKVGSGIILDSGTGRYPVEVSSFSNAVLVIRSWNASNVQTIINSTTPFTWAAGDRLVFDFSIPIKNWATGNLLSTQEASYQTATTSTNGVTPTGTITGTVSKATFGTIDSDDFSLYSGGVWTALRDGRVDVTAYVPMSHTSETGITAEIRVRNTTTSKDVRTQQFLPGASTSTHPQCSGTLEVTKGDTLEIQVSNNAAAGRVFQADANFTIKYQEKFKTFGAYRTKGLIKDSNSTLTLVGGTLGQWVDVGSVTCNPNEEYDISALVTIDESGGAASSQNIEIGIGTVSGNDDTGIVNGLTKASINFTTGVSDIYSMVIPPHDVNPTVSTTYYLKVFMATSVTNVACTYSIRARLVN